MASSFYFISLGLSWLASYDYLFISHYENISSSSFVLGLRSFTPSRARMPDRKTDFLSAFPRISSKLSSSSTIGGLGTAYSICIFLGGVETFSSIFVLLGSVEMCPCCPCCWFMPSITFSLADLFINFLLSSFKKSLFLRTVGWIQIGAGGLGNWLYMISVGLGGGGGSVRGGGWQVDFMEGGMRF